jgi:hypothetical protein
MSKKDLDKFLGARTKSPLNTDKIYGGTASKFDTITTTKKTVTVTEVVVTVTE